MTRYDLEAIDLRSLSPKSRLLASLLISGYQQTEIAQLSQCSVSSISEHVSQLRAEVEVQLGLPPKTLPAKTGPS